MENDVFVNTQAFGTLMRTLRMKAGLSFDAVAKRGGPSDRYQKDIESGVSMPITPETITKYIDALASADIGVNASFFNAMAAAHRAAAAEGEEAEDIAGTPIPSHSVGFLLGLRLDGGNDLMGGTLSYPVAGIASELAAQVNEHAFLEAAGRIAARHRDLTLVPWRFAVTEDLRSAAYWPSYHVFRVGVADSLGDKRLAIDPLTGITTLADAYVRAATLGAAGSDRAHLAWAILLANADAATAGRGPLVAWIVAAATATNSHPWGELLGDFADATWLTITGTTSPGPAMPQHRDDVAGVREIINSAKPYLAPWVEELLMAHQLRFTTGSEDGTAVITWRADGFDLAKGGPPKQPTRRLWYYDDAALPALPTILDNQEIPNLVLHNDKLSATGSRAAAYVWCPVTGSNRYAIVQRRSTDTWIPVQLY